MVGIGGGKTIDVAKYAATRRGLPMVSVATSLANDGIASPVASLITDGIKGSYGVHIPIAVIVDLDFVESGPDRHNRAGIGDVISNISALADWELARQVRGEPVDGLAASLSRAGAEAVLNHPGDMTDDAFVIVLAEALISSGLAMAVDGTSRPCSGGCHEIMHAVDSLFPGTASHGELAGLGALFCTWLRGDLRRFGEMSACLARHGLPRLPAEVGAHRRPVRRGGAVRAAYPAGPLHHPRTPGAVAYRDAGAAGRLRRCNPRPAWLTPVPPSPTSTG